MESKPKICCFIGHRKVKEAEKLKEKLFNTIETLKSKYVETIQESVRKKTEQLATKQENLLSEFNNMCASGITMSDFHACQKLFTQYNQTLRNLQKLKKQRIK